MATLWRGTRRRACPR